MARRRYLQPGFWQNPQLSKCPPLTRLLFQVIWTHADFDGCFLWEPDALAMKGLPRDEFDAVEAMERLERDGFLRSYVVGGKRFGYVVNWHKHQDPHPGEKPVHPKPDSDPFFLVKVKEPKWRKPGDVAYEVHQIGKGVHPYQQLASNLPATCQQVPSNGKEGREGPEGKEGLYQEVPVPRLEHTLGPPRSLRAGVS